MSMPLWNVNVPGDVCVRGWSTLETRSRGSPKKPRTGCCWWNGRSGHGYGSFAAATAPQRLIKPCQRPPVYANGCRAPAEPASGCTNSTTAALPSPIHQRKRLVSIPPSLEHTTLQDSKTMVPPLPRLPADASASSVAWPATQKGEAPMDACAYSGASGRSDRCNRVADDRYPGPYSLFARNAVAGSAENSANSAKLRLPSSRRRTSGAT